MCGLRLLRETALPVLRMLVTRGRDRVRLVGRPDDQLPGIRPAPERALDLTNREPLVLLTHVQTPVAIRRLGAAGLEESPRSQKVHSAATPAVRIVAAAGVRADHAAR